jgi:hypothetical protein
MDHIKICNMPRRSTHGKGAKIDSRHPLKAVGQWKSGSGFLGSVIVDDRKFTESSLVFLHFLMHLRHPCFNGHPVQTPESGVSRFRRAVDGSLSRGAVAKDRPSP